MEGGRPWALGMSGCAVPQHGVEFSLGHGQAVQCKAAGYWWTGRRVYMVYGVVPHLTMDAIGFVSSGNSSRRLSVGMPLAMTFTLGIDGGAVRPGADSEVTPSSRWLFLQSMRSP